MDLLAKCNYAYCVMRCHQSCLRLLLRCCSGCWLCHEPGHWQCPASAMAPLTGTGPGPVTRCHTRHNAGFRQPRHWQRAVEGVCSVAHRWQASLRLSCTLYVCIRTYACMRSSTAYQLSTYYVCIQSEPEPCSSSPKATIRKYKCKQACPLSVDTVAVSDK